MTVRHHRHGAYQETNGLSPVREVWLESYRFGREEDGVQLQSESSRKNDVESLFNL